MFEEVQRIRRRDAYGQAASEDRSLLVDMVKNCFERRFVVGVDIHCHTHPQPSLISVTWPTKTAHSAADFKNAIPQKTPKKKEEFH